MTTALVQSKPEVMPQSMSSESQEPQKGEVKSLNDFDGQMEKLVPTCGTVTLTEEQKKILYTPVNEKDIEIVKYIDMGNSLCNMICLSLWDRRLTKFFYGDVTHAQVLLRST